MLLHGVGSELREIISAMAPRTSLDFFGGEPLWGAIPVARPDPQRSAFHSRNSAPARKPVAA